MFFSLYTTSGTIKFNICSSVTTTFSSSLVDGSFVSGAFVGTEVCAVPLSLELALFLQIV